MINDQQICWGEAALTPTQKVDRTEIHNFTAAFPAFAAPPVITASPVSNYAKSAPIYAIYVSNAGIDQWTGTLIKISGGEGIDAPTIKLPFVAAGPRKK